MIELLNKQVFLDKDYHIKEYYTELGNVRVLFCKDAIQSACYLDEWLKYELCDVYFQFYDLPVLLNPHECVKWQLFSLKFNGIPSKQMILFP